MSDTVTAEQTTQTHVVFMEAEEALLKHPEALIPQCHLLASLPGQGFTSTLRDSASMKAVDRVLRCLAQWPCKNTHFLSTLYQNVEANATLAKLLPLPSRDEKMNFTLLVQTSPGIPYLFLPVDTLQSLLAQTAREPKLEIFTLDRINPHTHLKPSDGSVALLIERPLLSPL